MAAGIEQGSAKPIKPNKGAHAERMVAATYLQVISMAILFLRGPGCLFDLTLNSKL